MGMASWTVLCVVAVAAVVVEGQLGQDVCFPGEQQRGTPAVKSPDPAFPRAVEEFIYNFFKQIVSLSASQSQGTGQGQKEKSMIISPYSVWNVLGLAYFGSLGNTQRQMEQAMSFINKSHTFSNWRNLQFLMDNSKGGAQLNTANRGYFSDLLELNRCLENTLFDVEKVDFRQSHSALNLINNYVSTATQGRIRNLITSLPPSTRFVLINAIFFKGSWETEFDPKITGRQEFLVPHGRSGAVSSGNVQMMNRVGEMRTGISSVLGATVLELPYRDSQVSMYLLLPTDEFAPTSELLNKLTPQTFADAVGNLEKIPVELKLPKFKLSSKFEKEIIAALAGLGVTDLFDARLANLKGYTTTLDLHVDTAIHQANIEVNEEGTVATAATALINTRFGPQQTTRIIFNRPFVFMIVEKRTLIPLFMGRVTSARDLE